jgi:hypothetical protein
MSLKLHTLALSSVAGGVVYTLDGKSYSTLRAIITALKRQYSLTDKEATDCVIELKAKIKG